MNTDSRIIDLIEKAGGLTQNADTSNINLSKKLKDEMVIIIYSKEEMEKINSNEKPICECPENNDGCIDDEKQTNTQNNKKETKNKEKININTASIEEIKTLSGIGESKAQAIIEYREKNGDFKRIEDLMNIKGIGESIIDKIKNQATV